MQDRVLQGAAGLSQSQADMLWRVHFRGSSRYLLLQVEFLSATERYLSARAFCHIALAYNALISAKGRRRKLAPGALLPPALAVTVYNGRERWAAPDDIFDLIEPVRGWLAERQPGCSTRCLTCVRWRGNLKPQPSRTSWRGSRAWNSTPRPGTSCG